jgi:hypothetical protein
MPIYSGDEGDKTATIKRLLQSIAICECNFNVKKEIKTPRYVTD